jgi:hypothetical protein
VRKTGPESLERDFLKKKKMSGSKCIIKALKRIEMCQKRIDYRTRMLASGLREFFRLGEIMLAWLHAKTKLMWQYCVILVKLAMQVSNLVNYPTNQTLTIDMFLVKSIV